MYEASGFMGNIIVAVLGSDQGVELSISLVQGLTFIPTTNI